MKNKWIIFDMDNTLIDTGPLYINASARLGDLMMERGFDRDEVIKKQDEIDVKLFEEHGYSTDRFAESFELTVKHFLEGGGFWPRDGDNIVKQARRMAMSVFDQTSIEYDYAASVVRQMANAGYKVGVITAGERWVQIKRFDDLTMRNLFHDCWVVLKKTSEVFDDFCIKHNVDKKNSWMIGDSIRSDILPSTTCGLNAIHLDTSSWTSIEVDKDQVSSNVITVPDLSHAPDIILGVKTNG
jgi:putative hydrolase of the HAD superfamily